MYDLKHRLQMQRMLASNTKYARPVDCTYTTRLSNVAFSVVTF